MDKRVDEQNKNTTTIAQDEKTVAASGASKAAENYLNTVYDDTGVEKVSELPDGDQKLIHKVEGNREEFTKLSESDQNKIIDIFTKMYKLDELYYGYDMLDAGDQYSIISSMNLVKSFVAMGKEQGLDVKTAVDEKQAVVSDDGGTVELPEGAVMVTVGDNESTPIQKIVMKNENGRWKVDPSAVINESKRMDNNPGAGMMEPEAGFDGGSLGEQ